MMIRLYITLSLTALVWAGVGVGTVSGWNGIKLQSNINLVDLTYTYDEKTLRWPEFRPFHKERMVHRNVSTATGNMSGTITAEDITMAIHSGTHMDAPLHFINNGDTIDQLPIEHFVRRPGVLLDITANVVNERDYAILVSDLETWEQLNGPIPAGAIILIRTGMSQYWGDAEQYIGTAAVELEKVKVPGISAEAAQWLIDHRTVVGIGIEGLSLDSTKNDGFKGHLLVLGNGIFILENLGPNIAKLPPVNFLVSAFPLSIREGSGAPTRVICELNPSANSRAGTIHGYHPLPVVILLALLFLAGIALVYAMHH